MSRDRDCTACPFHEISSHVNVNGGGNRNAKIAIIVESPTASLAKSGNPFTSPQGKLLKELLENSGIDPSEVFVTHTVGCVLPPKTKVKVEHIKACQPHLKQELDEVNPEWTVLCGASSIKLIKRSSIVDAHASPVEFDGRNYFPIISPSIIHRDITKRPVIEAAFEKLQHLVEGTYEEPEEIDWELVTEDNVEEFLEYAATTKRYSFDTETTGLIQQHPDFRVNSIAFTFSNSKTWVLPLELNEDRKWATRTLRRAYKRLKSSRSIGHNGKFDVISIYAAYGIHFYLDDDTMMMSHTMNENSPHDLKYLSKIHCGAPDYDDLTLAEKTGKVKDQKTLLRLFRYNAYDSHYTLQLWSHFRQKIRSSSDLTRLYRRLVMPAVREMTRIDFMGHHIDLKMKRRVRKELVEKIEQLRQEMQKLSRSKQIINWGSPTQVAKVLYSRLGLPCTQFTENNKPSTSESALLELILEHPIVSKLLDWRGAQKQLNTYIDGFDPLMVEDYLYISTKLNGTVTGRYSSRLHQTPRDGTIRNIMDAPPGYRYFCADFSQIELRLVAHASGDSRLTFIYQTGGDVHITTAQETMGVMRDPTKEERKAAKAINFGYVYGMGYRKFRKYAKEKYGVELTEGEAKAFRDRFFRLYAGLIPWHDRVKRMVREDGVIRYLSGRYRRLPGVYANDEGVRAEAERQAVNSPIQGFGSGDLKVMAMVALMDRFHPDKHRFQQLGDEVIIIGEVHDSVLGWIREDVAEERAYEIKSIMETPPLLNEFEIDLSVPLLVEVDVGSAWGKPDFTIEGNPPKLISVAGS